jgi:hypothetical protein
MLLSNAMQHIVLPTYKLKVVRTISDRSYGLYALRAGAPSY